MNFRIKLVGKESDQKAGTVLSQSIPVGEKFNSSQNNDITLEYATEKSIILDYELQGKDLAYAADYFESNNFNYRFLVQKKEFFTKEELFQHIWGMESVGDIATVTVHIKKIREKIEVNTSKPQYIETIWGVGYRFKV